MESQKKTPKKKTFYMHKFSYIGSTKKCGHNFFFFKYLFTNTWQIHGKFGIEVELQGPVNLI